MTQSIIELLLFFIPGVMAEQIFCQLTDKNTFKWKQLFQVCCFSMFALALRCVISMISGHGDLELGVVFHGIENFIKYCAISGVMVVFTPPCIVIFGKLVSKLKAEEIEQGIANEIMEEKACEKPH